MNKLQEKLYEALEYKYKAQISEAEAGLLIYFNNSVGIGEHPQHIEEMDKFIGIMTDARDKIETLETFKLKNI